MGSVKKFVMPVAAFFNFFKLKKEASKNSLTTKMSDNSDHDDSTAPTNQDGTDLHPFLTLKPKKKDFDKEAALIIECVNFLKNHLANRKRRQPKGMNNRRPTKCNCLSFMKDDNNSDEVEAVARYMIYFGGLKGDEQKVIVSERRRT